MSANGRQAKETRETWLEFPKRERRGLGHLPSVNIVLKIGTRELSASNPLFALVLAAERRDNLAHREGTQQGNNRGVAGPGIR